MRVTVTNVLRDKRTVFNDVRNVEALRLGLRFVSLDIVLVVPWTNNTFLIEGDDVIY